MQPYWKQETVINEFFDDLLKKAETKVANKSEEEKTIALANVQPKAWIQAASEKANGIEYTTHAVKATNPIAGTKADPSDVTTIIAKRSFVNNGLLHNGNAPIDVDATANAALLPILKFLELRMSDGKRLIDHIEDNSEIAQSILGECDDPEKARNQFLETVSDRNGSIHSTSNHLPQVYFPINDINADEDYHLLSVLRSTSMMYALKNRINEHRFGEKAKAAREARFNGDLGEKYLDIRNLTGIGFGGTQPQNVSNLNSKNAGVALLFDSAPPVITFNNKIRIPKLDFFREGLTANRRLLTSFHNMAQASKYVTGVNEWRDNVIGAAFEQIVRSVYALREAKPNWSAITELPEWQKVVLDVGLKDDETVDRKEMMQKFVKEAVEWFVRSYQHQLKDEAVELGEAEFNFIFKIFTEQCEDAIS